MSTARRVRAGRPGGSEGGGGGGAVELNLRGKHDQGSIMDSVFRRAARRREDPQSPGEYR